MPATKKPQSWLITLPVAGAAAAYVWYVFLPGQKTLSELRSELQSKQSFAMSLAKYEGDARSTPQEIDKTRQYLDRAQRALISPSDMSRLYGEIAAIAKQAGVETTRFSPDPPKAFTRLTKFPVNLACTGSYAQVSALLEGLEHLPQRLWLEHVSIEADGGDEGLLRCELILEVFANNSGFSS